MAFALNHHPHLVMKHLTVTGTAYFYTPFPDSMQVLSLSYNQEGHEFNS
jgi:hypothetical protein